MKIKIKIISFLFILTLLVSCKTYYFNEYEWERPNKMNFKLAKENFMLNEKSILDVNSVYIHRIEFEHETYFSFLRFFNNGRVFYSFPYKELPTEKECNNIRNGLIGYYTLSGNELEYEIFGQISSEGFRYVKYFALIENEEINTYKLKFRKDLFFHKSIFSYEKYEMNLYTKPDW